MVTPVNNSQVALSYKFSATSEVETMMKSFIAAYSVVLFITAANGQTAADLANKYDITRSMMYNGESR